MRAYPPSPLVQTFSRQGNLRRGFHGFTLIELLVVITIIGVLVSMLLPTLSQSRELARNAYCSAGARGAQLAVDVYANDEKDYIVTNPTAYTGTPTSNPASPGYPANAPDSRNWAGVLVDRGYTQPFVFTNKGGCPYGPPVSQMYLYWWGNDYYVDTTNASIAYGLNPILQGGYGYYNPYVSPYIGFQGQAKRSKGRIAQQGASRVVYVTCCATPWGNTTPYPAVALYHTMGVRTNYTVTVDVITGFRERRHDGKGLPMIMGDGHGEFVLKEKVAPADWTISWDDSSVMASLSWKNLYAGTFGVD